MGRPRRQLQAAAAETCRPPAELKNGQEIAQVRKAEGNNLYTVKLPTQDELILVELPARFRSAIWIKRGSYVVIDRLAFEGRDNKLHGEIINIVREEKQWRKQTYWPAEFVKKSAYPSDSDEEESTTGKMPSSEDDGSE